MSEQTCASFTQGHKETVRTLVANICLLSDVTTPMQSSSAKSRCLICLAGEPLILKSVGMGKRLDRERPVPFNSTDIGNIQPIFSPRRSCGKYVAFVACSLRMEYSYASFSNAFWMHLFSNMRISVTRRLPWNISELFLTYSRVEYFVSHLTGSLSCV